LVFAGRASQPAKQKAPDQNGAKSALGLSTICKPKRSLAERRGIGPTDWRHIKLAGKAKKEAPSLGVRGA
jgi:hypothetical protein